MTEPAMLGVGEIVGLSATELSMRIHRRQHSCVEVMQAYLDQIDAFNPKVNAIVSLVERSDLLKAAAERDELMSEGCSLGWMHGLPIAVKDLVEAKGIPMTRGSPLFREFVPTQDAIVVERMKQAGAIVIGKTNVPEFGLGSQTYNPVFGTTLNAYDQTKTAGGSSGGAAAALALRMLPIADGSDMMGSLRNPAAYNAVVGFRPSFGRVPGGSASDVFYRQFSTEGPMGRSVADVAMLLSVQAGFDPRAPLSLGGNPKKFKRSLRRDCRGVRVGWLGDWNAYLPIEPEILTMCEAGLRTLEDAGCTVSHALPQFSPELLWECWLTLRQWSVAQSLGDLLKGKDAREQIKPEALWEIDRGLRLTVSELMRAMAVRTQWYAAVCALFERFDYLVLPSAQVFPFDAKTKWPTEVVHRTMDTYHRWMEVVIGPTLAGLPAISVPLGLGEAGLPMGFQIIGPPRGDFGVLQMAHRYEQLSRFGRMHPPLLRG